MIIYIPAYAVLVTASISDIKRKEIPAWLFAAALVLSLAAVLTGLLQKTEEPFDLIISTVPGLIMLSLALLSGGGLGYGDGLLAVILGPVFGWELMAAGICLAFLLSAVISLFLLVFKKADRKTCLPFVPFFASAMGVVSFAFR